VSKLLRHAIPQELLNRASCKTPIACLIISRREAKQEDAGGRFWHDAVLNAIIITPAKWMLPDRN
jgi:hypothetical protein